MGVGDADMHGRKLIHDRQNLVHTKQLQLHLRGAGGEASILCCTTGGDWWETIASSAGELGPISGAGGGAASILCCGGLPIATGGGWLGVITSSAEKCGPLVSTVVNGCATAVDVDCANAYLADGVQLRAAIGSVSCNWETNPVEVVIVRK